MQRFLFILFVSFLFHFRVLAQNQPESLINARIDTLQLNMVQAEELFIKNNLNLLSQRLDIDAAKAAIIQARLFPNPTLALEQNLYNPTNNKYFDAGKSGQNIVELQQLIELAGKRNKRIQIEKINTKLTEFQYFDLLRSLRFELRTSLVELSYLIQNLAIYESKTEPIRKLVIAYEAQLKKGNVSLKEVTRLKALIFSLENERLELVHQVNDREAAISLLLNAKPTTFILPVLDETRLNTASTTIVYNQLLETATENRYDLKLYQTNIALQEAQLNYQKALAVPDVGLGAIYDRQGSFIRDYVGLQAQFSLPFFNRNQGNIKTAKILVDKSRTDLQHYQNQVEQEVMAAYNKVRETDKIYTGLYTNFSQDFDKLLDGITESFSKRNISLIEFVDYYETYTESITQMLQLKTNRIRALEEINFAVGTPVIQYQ
ncbi:TolC family protein [Adhaeribacter rhizoryzae]|uniref:TolC family protein n=1 Tax=Adhaeribacter rhizoryzae TaxID=2607907 RepID=A0A5M6DPW5_9BACT|nr:TolC family protein [Adhaeribacter rhizoryzae]KAA5549567.1 TolC family protein [Adhaeribacter rhizoryzae]